MLNQQLPVEFETDCYVWSSAQKLEDQQQPTPEARQTTANAGASASGMANGWCCCPPRAGESHRRQSVGKIMHTVSSNISKNIMQTPSFKSMLILGTPQELTHHQYIQADSFWASITHQDAEHWHAIETQAVQPASTTLCLQPLPRFEAVARSL